jgi:hypothetical protein
MKHSDHIRPAGAVGQGDPHRAAALYRVLRRGHRGVLKLQSRTYRYTVILHRTRQMALARSIGSNKCKRL